MRGHIFNAGPGCLPVGVLEQVREGVVELNGFHQSVLEISHRSPIYCEIQAQAEERLRRLLGIGSEFKILFLTGGASTQFAMLPLNVLQGRSADYIVSGAWSSKALAEAQRIGRARAAGSSKEAGFTHLPRELELDPEAAYLHFTSNNTIFGTEYLSEPDAGGRPLVCDASSDFLSRPLDMSRYAMLYAGAQKNLGPAGVSLVLLRPELLPEPLEQTPMIWRYQTHLAKNSAYNTPPVFAVWVVGLVLQWIESLGGLTAIEERNRAKAELLYAALDGSDGYYRGTVEPDSRSRMNVPFRLPTPELESLFLKEANEADLIGLKGHRSVGGLRASIYNAVEPASVQALVDFMAAFRAAHPAEAGA